ncbi:hypothetical protein BV898_11542 [Hypsibius exemplaris]|uniref:Uncharacterized protein n=1 Tax=Hypsibius exemplaris TaxID=2072580 RepID=A0A1W0WGJ5_HYPEX|nr:hypothetical protein BV898_11542 [Hypsibius exemplaris]
MPPQLRSRDGRAVLMQELDIPIFFIRRLGDRQFLVGGGGGSSKTGIPNAVYLFSLTNRNGRCYLRESQKVDTGAANPMNASVYEVTSSSLAPIVIDPRTRLPSISHSAGEQPPTRGGRLVVNAVSQMQQAEKEIMRMLSTVKELVAVGLDNTCSVYQISRALPKQAQPDPGTLIAKDDLLSILYRQSIETVPGKDNIQQCCAFIPPDPSGNGTPTDPRKKGKDARLVTGGSDGIVRFWTGSDFHIEKSLKAHDDEITDMDVSCTGDEIITCGRDHQAHVWNIKTGKLSDSAKPEFPEAKGVKYRPRKARFDCKDPSVLYVIWIPVIRQRKRQDPSMLCRYRFRKSRLELVGSVPVKGDSLSALSVSPDGQYLATGNLDGSVCIIRSDSLSVIYYSDTAHETFVTDLEFADCTFGAKVLTRMDAAQCTLFSVSADRKIMLHQADFHHAKLEKCRKWVGWSLVIWLIALVFYMVSAVGVFSDITSSFRG